MIQFHFARELPLEHHVHLMDRGRPDQHEDEQKHGTQQAEQAPFPLVASQPRENANSKQARDRDCRDEHRLVEPPVAVPSFGPGFPPADIVQ